MTLPGIETQQLPQIQASDSQPRRHITAIRPPEVKAPDSSKHQQETKGAPIQDHVTLSKEAQRLAATNSQTSKNNTFQQTPSPFDQ